MHWASGKMSLRREHKDKKTFASAIFGNTKSGLVPVQYWIFITYDDELKKKILTGEKGLGRQHKM